MKKAKKEYDKLQEKCTKDPDKCDVEALQAAQTNLMAAKRNADAATKNREDIDGTTAANEKAAADAEAAAAEAAAAEEAARQQEIYDYMDGEEPNEAEIQAYNCKDSSTGESCTLTADNASTCKCEYKEVYTDAMVTPKRERSALLMNLMPTEIRLLCSVVMRPKTIFSNISPAKR